MKRDSGGAWPALMLLMLLTAAVLLGVLLWSGEALSWAFWFSNWFWQALLVGFLGQIIDGALGMAYGLSCSSFLLAQGLPPATASAAVHLAEVFTTGFSGLAHWRQGNVERRLFRTLLLGGSLGAVLGAWFLGQMNPARLRFWIHLYLALMGAAMVYKAWAKRFPARQRALKKRFQAGIALLGGALDAIGGGGWGAVVVVNLLHYGSWSPRQAIGTVNAVEFFLTFLVSAVLFSQLPQPQNLAQLSLGLMLGGVLAAPLAARLLHVLPPRLTMALVGMLILGLSVWQLF